MARTAKARERPANYPKLTDYQPTRFMLPESHYDAAEADRAVRFIENLCHTKGRWAGKPFWLLPWQEQIIRDIFGIVNEDDTRQFRTAYVEIPKKNGKSELLEGIRDFFQTINRTTRSAFRSPLTVSFFFAFSSMITPPIHVP